MGYATAMWLSFGEALATAICHEKLAEFELARAGILDPLEGFLIMFA